MRMFMQILSRRGSLAIPAAVLLMGLLLGLPPGTAQAQDEAGASAGESITEHIVQPGETLSEIAKQYGTTTATLLTLNGLDNADYVWVGLPIRLPTAVENPPTPVPDAVIANDDAGAPEAIAQASVADEVAPPVTVADLEAPLPNRFVDADGAFRYIVEPGDTLDSIAAEFRVGVSVLVDLNRLSPAQRLTPGQSIFVPYSPYGGGRDRIHIVQPGESLGLLAKRYATTLDALVARNGITDASLITPGRKLIVPPPAAVERMTVLPIDADGLQRPLIFPTLDEKWIDVDLSEQLVTAYDGAKPVKSFVISSGKPGTPTVTGTFRIWIKTSIQDMWGGERGAADYYYLPDVKWVQYFYQDYSFHTAYWHDDFGTPTSRGCINMREEDAKWLFDWAGPEWDDAGEAWQKPAEENLGTLVVVHE